MNQPTPRGPQPPAAHSPAAYPEPFELPARLEPHPSLLTYYVLTSLMLGPGFVFMLVPLYFRYHTLRYQIDEGGISMSWGILFRREVSLAFERIQDIHLSSNFVERWLGLGKIQVQTASGSATAEMTIEGVPHYEALRDFLYSRMRGARGTAAAARAGEESGAPGGDLASQLEAAAADIREIRLLLEKRLARPADG